MPQMIQRALERSDSTSAPWDVPAGSETVRRSWLDRITPYVAIARIDHWCKNAFMALGALLACFYDPPEFGWMTVLQVVAAVLATCLLASSNYVLNEILDAPTDRHHKVKQYRPIPSGRVWLPLAYVQWIVLGLAGLAISWTVNVPFFFTGLSLLVMGVLYNVPPIRLKELAYVDVLSESVNNPIRLLLGWFALTGEAVPPVSLMIAYWMVGAFFMAAKRFAEYRSIADPVAARAYRASFGYYNEQRLLISMFAYTTTFALFLGVFIIRYHVELILSFPLVAGFLGAYLRVAFRRDSAAQKPERLYREKKLMAYLGLSVLAFVVLMFTHIPACYTWFNVPASSVTPLWKLGGGPDSARE